VYIWAIPSNGCFSASTVFVLSKYATVGMSEDKRPFERRRHRYIVKKYSETVTSGESCEHKKEPSRYIKGEDFL
jgi:hypothetical protein